MRRLSLSLALFLMVLSATFTLGQVAVDPCNSNTPKASVAVNIASATTTQLIALSGTKSIYVCAFGLTAQTTAPTVQFEYGTGASCGTGTTVLTGAMAPTAGSYLNHAYTGTLFSAPAGNALCMVTGGTPSIQGWVTYIQQ